MFRHQILFTVPEDVVSPVPHGEGESHPIVTNIIKLHKLKKIAQWSVNALGVEAIVAEFKRDREIEDVLRATVVNHQQVVQAQVKASLS